MAAAHCKLCSALFTPWRAPVLLHKPTYFTNLYLHFHGWYNWPTIAEDDFHDMVWWTCTNNGHHLVKGITIFIKITSRFLVFIWPLCTWQTEKWVVCGRTVSFVTSSGELWTQLWEGRHFGRCTCLPHKSVVGTVWQLHTWFLDVFVKCTRHRDMTLYMHLSLFLAVWYVMFVLCSAEVMF